MKKESRYRKDMDTLQAMVDEANKKKKWWCGQLGFYSYRIDGL